jgi:hypothetical protein
MEEFEEGEEYYGAPDNNNFEHSSRQLRLSALEESSPLMQEEDGGQYSGQNSEPEWKAAQRQSPMRQSRQIRGSQQMRQSQLSTHSQQFQHRRRTSQHSMNSSQQMMRLSQFSGGGDDMNRRRSFVSTQSMQRRDFDPNRNQSIRQSNTSHRSGQSLRHSQFSNSHRGSQFNQKHDEVSDMTDTIEDTARARRGSVNDLSTLDTVTLRSIGHEENCRVFDDSNELYHMPTARGIDLCADNEDPLNAAPLDTTSIATERTKLTKRKRKLKIWCGLIVLLLLLGAIAVSVLIVTGVIPLDVFQPNKSNTPNISVQNMTDDGVSTPTDTNTMVLEEIGSITAQPTISFPPSLAPSTTPSLFPSNRKVIDVLDIPPDDLEGRCSPSNFPYTIEVCKDACKVAECCYLNADGVVLGCFDTSTDTYNGRLNTHRCTLYRPHCDVFFDPWTGGEDGMIRPPPDNLDQLCRKRLREEINQPNRALDFEDDVCLEACLPSKCCQSMEVAGESDIESIISYLGYVMTSCEQSNSEECSAYNATCFGIFDGPPQPEPIPSPSGSPSLSPTLHPTEISFVSSSPTLVPTRDPSFRPSIETTIATSELSYSHSPSYISSSARPSTGPSISQTTLLPTRLQIVPIANLPKIFDACTSPKSKNLIALGNLAAKVECVKACEPGLCCFAEILRDAGLTDSSGNPANIQSCFDSNRGVCEGYSGCLALTNPVSVNSAQSFVPEVPTQDLSSLCSEESRATPTGVLNCFQECQRGSCCTLSPQESCFNGFQDICEQYGPCQAMVDAYGGDTSNVLPPKPPTNLDLLCSYEYLLDKKNEHSISDCEGACASIGCCLKDECPANQADFEVTALDRCALYSPCQKLYLRDKMQACLEEGLSSEGGLKCESACDVASCCFPQQGEESCFPLYEDLCLVFAPFCAPKLVSEGSSWKEVPPPPSNLPTLCLTGFGGDKTCLDACAPSRCCFATSQSCFAENEDVCADWNICASRIQDQEEQEEGFEE